MTETKTIISIETGAAVKNIKELKDNVAFYKKALQEAEIGSTDYKNTLDKLRVSQNALKDAMYASEGSMEDVARAANGVGSTYNALVHRMAELKQALRATDVSTKAGKDHFDDLARQINAINDELKVMDAAQGNFQRNVGNYLGVGNKWIKSLGDVTQGMAAAGAGTKGLTTAMKVLSATPAVMILGTLAGLLTKTTDALKGSEKGMSSATEAMALFGGVTDTITKLLQGLGQGVAWVGEKMAALYKQVFGETEAMKTRAEVVKGNIELAKQERETIVKNAEAERDIAELREKASDKERYTAEERLEFQRRSGELENEIAERAAEDLRTQYELIKQKNSLVESSAEDLKKEAEAYAAMINAETAYLDKKRMNNKKVQALSKELANEQKEAAKESVEAFKTAVQAEVDLIDQELELVQKGSEEELALNREKLGKLHDIAVAEAKFKIQDKEALNKTLLVLEQKYLKQVTDLDLAVYQRELDELHALIDPISDEIAESFAKGIADTFDEEKKANEVAKSYAEQRLADMDKATARRLDLNDLEVQSEREKAEAEYEIQRDAMERKAELLESLAGEAGERGDLDAQLEYEQMAADLQYEIWYSERMREKELDEQAMEDKRANAEKTVAVLGSVANATAGILETIADLYEQDDKSAKKNAKKIKAMRIATATIDTIAGAVGAFATAAANPGGIPGMIIGAANAATVTAAGIAQIAKIKKTDIGGSEAASPSVGAAVSAPSVSQSVPEVRNITSASEEERLNKMAGEQRVVLVMSDLEAKQETTRVRVQESSF